MIIPKDPQYKIVMILKISKFTYSKINPLPFKFQKDFINFVKN